MTAFNRLAWTAKISLTIFALLGGYAWAESSFDAGMRFKQQEKFAEAAAAFRETVNNEPQNALAWEQLATVESWLNHFDVSIDAWRSLLNIAPNQASAHAGLARVLYWKGERAQALQEVDIALGLDAGNADLLVLKGDILLADGKPAPARAAYQQAQTLAPGNADIAKKIARTAEPKTWRLDVGYIGDDYSALRSGESSAYLQIGKQLSADTSLYVRADQYDSFSKTDTGLTPGGYFRLAPWYLLNAELGFNVDTPDFRPKQMATFNSEFLIAGVVQPLLGLRYMQYDAGVATAGGNVTTLTPGARILMPLASLELRYGYSQNLDNSRTGVFQSKLSFEREKMTPYLVFATGEEALPPLAKAKVTVVGVGCVWNLSSAWGARVDFSHEDRDGFYKHDALGAGLSWHF